MKKHLILFLLLASLGCNSQIIIGAASQQNKNKRIDTTPSNNNLVEEIAYFSAYFLAIEDKDDLQLALNTYSSIRLDKGDYSGEAITMTSNQKLFGHPSITVVPEITISGGSIDGHVENIRFSSDDGNLTLGTGDIISGWKFKNITRGILVSSGAKVENNFFLHMRVRFNIDNSTSGYFRNNNTTLFQVQGWPNQLVIKGNDVTPSYGNVHIFTNLLTPGGDASELDNLESATFIGLDSEAWNFNETGTRAALYVRNSGEIRVTDFGGGTYSNDPTPPADIEADNFYYLNKGISGDYTGVSVIRPNTNVFGIFDYDDNFTFSGTGFNFRGHLNNTTNVSLNGSNITSEIPDPTTKEKLITNILGIERTPYPRPEWEELPNPTGSNWEINRIGKTDSQTYIQGLIDTNNVAELDEGVYYIGSTLTLKNNDGIIGKGTGKTAIVGLTDDFPLITIDDVDSYSVVMANMTLQGGSHGILVPTTSFQLTGGRFSYLVFRNQNYGFHLEKCYALDNNFFDNVSFVDCNIGFFQDPDPTHASTPEGDRYSDTAYVDKVVFYKTQVINCGTGFSMFADRADNLNAWVDCLFDGNGVAVELSGHNYPMFVNCDFTNHEDDFIMELQSLTSFYNCSFYDNSTPYTFYAKGFLLEGTTIIDDAILNKTGDHIQTFGYIVNSKITGDKGLVTQGMFVNSELLSNPSLSKMLVNIKHPSSATVIIDESPAPYPQLLVKH